MEQRKESFGDLYSAVFNIKLVEENASLELILFMMWMLETSRLPFGNKLPPNDHPFIPIAKTLSQLFEAAEYYEVYWISKSIYGMAQLDMNGLVAQTYSELEIIDPNLLRQASDDDDYVFPFPS